MDEARIDRLLDQMTLKQKIGQMFVFTFYGSALNDSARDLLTEWQPGAVALLPSNLGTPEAITRLTNSLQSTVTEAGGLPLFIAVDQEGGLIQRLNEGFTRWPIPALLTASQDDDLAYRVGEAFAQELSAVGVNMNLGPVVDLDTNRLNPIIGRRSPGADPHLVARSAAAFVRGMQAGGVAATAKHFPGHGDTSEDSHLVVPLILHGRDRLEEIELVPFRALVDAGVSAVMVGHLAVPALTDSMSIPVSLSSQLVQGVLRTEIGYDGLVMPDAMDMDAIDTVYPPEQAALLAIEAGHDLILLGAHLGPGTFARAMQAVVDAVLRGEISEDRIDSSVRRILQTKEAYGLLEDFSPLDPAGVTARLNREKHAALVTEMFEKGITVVFNDGQLPLSEDTLLIYPATRPGLWRACAPYGARPLGVSETPLDEEIAWARTAARSAARIVIFSINAEANPKQRELLQTLPKERTTVVALWSPYDLLAIDRPAAYVVTYSPLPEAYEPLCAVLFGALEAKGVNPLQLD